MLTRWPIQRTVFLKKILRGTLCVLIKKSLAMLSYVLPFPVSAYHLLPLSQESMRWFRLTLVTSTIALLEASVPFAFVTIAFPLILFLVQVQRWPDGWMDGWMFGTFSSSLFQLLV